MKITFGEYTLTDYFKVQNINRSILPEKETTSITVAGRDGSYFNSTRYTQRIIEVDVLFNTKTSTTYMKLLRNLATMLDTDEPTQLIFDDEPDLIYYAVVDGSTNISNILNIGQGTITFLCNDVYIYSDESKDAVVNGNKLKFVNKGSASAYPILKAKFLEDATYINFTSPDSTVKVGSPASIVKKANKKKKYILNDNMESINNWNNAGNILDSNRENTGTIASNGKSIYCSNYGSGSSDTVWHGAGFRKVLSKTIKDFDMSAKFNFSSQDGTKESDGNQYGMLEIYLFNENGQKLSKMSMRDTATKFEFNIAEVEVGQKSILESNDNPPSGTKKLKKKYTYYTTKKNDKLVTLAKRFKISLATLKSLNNIPADVTQMNKGTKLIVGSTLAEKVVYPEYVGNFNDIYGEFTLKRVGKLWTATVSRLNDNGKKTYTIRDSYSGGSPSEVAYIVIAFLQYGKKDVVQVMNISDIKIKELNNSFNKDTDNDYIFEKGDELEIDCNDSSVWLNGDYFMTELNIKSEFIELPANATTTVKVSSDADISLEGEFTERFL